MRTHRDSSAYNTHTGQRRDRPPAPAVVAYALENGTDLYETFLQAGYSVAEATLFSEPIPEGPKCDKCHDQGQFQDTGNFCGCEAGQALKEKVFRATLEGSKIPEGYAKLTLDTWMQRLTDDQKRGKWLGYTAAVYFLRSVGHMFRLGECYEAMGVPFPQEITDDTARNSIVFYGPLGTGKTGLMSAIANEVLSREKLLYLRMGDLFDRVQDSYKDKAGPSSGKLIRKYATIPLLLLDEMTWENPSDDKRRILEGIMRPRCAEQLPFVATTNQTPEDFAKQWQGRISEVILESAHWIPVEGLNLRYKARSLKAI